MPLALVMVRGSGWDDTALPAHTDLCNQPCDDVYTLGHFVVGEGDSFYVSPKNDMHGHDTVLF